MLESPALLPRKIPEPTMRQRARLLVGFLLATLLAGCQSAPVRVNAATDESAAAGIAAPPDGTATDKPVAVSTWSAGTLADLLIGEVAGQRGQRDVALDAYLRQARLLRSPELSARATRIAWFARRQDAARDAAMLWAELAPADAEASANAVMALIQSGEIEAAAPLLDRLLADTAHPVRFNYLIQYARESDPVVRKRVVDLLAGLSAAHPQHPRLWLARASLAEMNGDLAQALALAQQARALDPAHPATLELEGRLLLATGNSEQARKHLQAASRKFPRERELRLTYLRALLDSGRGDDARNELADMLKLWPDDGDLALSLALVEWETGAAESALGRMVRLAEAGYREDEAWMYAGRIAFGLRRFDDAATYFQNVRGPMFLQAQVQVAYAWQRLGRLADARQLIAGLRMQAPESSTMLFIAESELIWRHGDAAASLALLDDALAARDQDRDLRYARAMAAERTGRIDIVESDLRALLATAPDNPMLLNALGYTLADRTDRYTEAHELIARALALSPDAPAIVDSMGWVQYRLGNLKEAIQWLRRAYAMSPDGEIAAHLGEVLWMHGDKRAARSTWKHALAREPDNAILLRTIERLAP